MTRRMRPITAVAIVFFLACAAAPLFVASWATLFALILAKGIVVLGIVLLLQAGQVSFGHAMFFAIGAYTAAFWGKYIGGGDVLLFLVLGGITSAVFGLLVGLGVMLYLAFFLIRDGRIIAGVIDRAAPLRDEERRAVLERFIVVIRATIKGSLIVAIAQGAVGGIVFWAIGMSAPLLWGVAMGFMSLLPAIGTGLIWVPVAIYLLATGAIWQGVTLIFCGLFVIGLVDNLLRPILVGRDARMPDYIAFISTLGGLELLGLNGFILGPAIAALFLVCWELYFTSSAQGPRT